MRSAVSLCVLVAFVLLENANATISSSYLTTRNDSGTSGLYPTGSTFFRTYPPPTTVTGSEQVEKVRLDIYYETDCPDSMRFITGQLYLLYQEMDDVLDIHLVPYGKADVSYNSLLQRYDFRCQHGPSECYGNTVQSCVMSLYPEKKDYFNFINCMEAYPRPSQNGHKCARRLSLDWEKIDKCATGEEGNRLLYKNAQLTDSLNPSLYFVPWIVVNKSFSRTNQRMALRNLQYVVCKVHQGNHPKCQR